VDRGGSLAKGEPLRVAAWVGERGAASRSRSDARAIAKRRLGEQR
jgi:hypothetical protein